MRLAVWTRKEAITEIKFDGTMDGLVYGADSIKIFKKCSNSEVILCTYSDLDYFIKALKKAKELWAT